MGDPFNNPLHEQQVKPACAFALVWRRYGHALPDEVAGAGEGLSAFRQARRV